MFKMNSKALEYTKARRSNFTKDETRKFMNLIDKYIIIASNKTDHATVYKKELAWKKIVEEFNDGATIHRNGKQLQYKFDNMKRNARNEIKKKTIEKHKADDPHSSKISTSIEWLNSITAESNSAGPSTDDDSDYILEFRPSSQESEGSYYIERKEKVDSASPREERFEFINDQCDSSPTSEELDSSKKRKFSFTENIEKKYIYQRNKEPEVIEKSNHKERLMIMLLEEEHKQKLQHKQDLHKIELEYKRNLYKLSLEKMRIEIEIEKQKLKSILT